MRHFILMTALTAAVGLGVVASTAQAQYPYNTGYYYSPYESRYGYDYDWPYRYDRYRYDRYDRYDPYSRSYYYRGYYPDYRGYYPYTSGYRSYYPYRRSYRGVYVNPYRGLNINTGRFRFRLGW